MRVSTAQIAQMVTQSLQGIKESGSLDLKVGSVVKATLLEILNNQDALIGIGSYKVRARLDADVQVGDKMALLVTGDQKSGAMELKLVSDPVKSNASQQPALDSQGLVKALGLPDEDSSKALVQEWVSRQVPLKADVLKAASDVLRSLPKPTPQQVATLGKMAELGIPLHGGSFAAMDALDNGPKLHDLLANVMTALQDVLPENEAAPATTTNHAVSANENAPAQSPVVESQTTTSQPPSSQRETVAQPAHSFPENKNSRRATTTGDTARSTLPEPVKEVLHQLSGLVRGLLKETDNAQALGDKAKQLGLGFEEHLGQAVRRLPADSDHAAVQAALHTASQADAETGANLKQVLLQAHAASSDLHAAGLGPLADDVNALLQNVTGQQMMQTPGQQERSDLFYQFAAVPTNVGGREQTVELHVMSRKGPNQKTLDPANCYVLFHLDMPNLGELDIHLHIVDKVVGVRFQSGEPDRVQITPDEQRDLWTAVKSVGFHLGTLKVEEKKPPAEGMQAPLLPPVLTQGALDLRL
ncbi:MAG: hypothetical protein ACXVO1_09680 [Tumebacillaceae bacterium]